MKQFWAFIKKETRHIFRDTRTMIILFGMPVVMMLLFGFAITTDVKDVRTVVVTTNYDHQTQRLVDRLNASEYFIVSQRVTTPAEAERLIRNQQADMGIVFSPQYANRPTSHGIQFITDGIDPNTALTRQAYAQQILSEQTQAPLSRMLYNPQMKSAYNFVPGIIGLLLTLICAMMTSVSIVKEKERGTMEVLLVSPMRPLLIMIAKAIPYLVLSLVILVTVILMSRYVLDVPLKGNITAIFLVSMLYILLALSFGLLVSVIASTQVTALLVSGMLLLIPCILLSGMIYPIESMPRLLQWLTAVMPARWFISAIKKLMIMGVSWRMALQEILVMSGMTVAILTIALAKFKTRLE